MRTIHTYRATNNVHRPTQSEDVSDLEAAISWALAAADATGHHSTISVTATEIPDPEYGGDRVLDCHTNVLGAVRPGSREIISRTDSRFPQGY